MERNGLVERYSSAEGRRPGSWRLRKKPRRQSSKGRRAEDGRAFRDDEAPMDIAPKRPTDLSKLAMVLSMLGSEHEGEVLSAARRAEEIRRRLATTWDRLLLTPDS